jgi:hypothetical protein
LIDWGFIYQKHTDSPTFPHLGKVGQIYGNIMVEWLAFCCCFPFFLFIIIVVLLLKGLHLPLDAGRGASPGVSICSFMVYVLVGFICFIIFVCFSSSMDGLGYM